MRSVLIDGSNISLYGAGSGKLTALAGLARVVNALLAHRALPYTIFDASFRYRTDEKSQARTDFVGLTKRTSEYFQIAPSGEEADLFLLETALANGWPILSNDTYRKYGGVKDGLIRYKGEDVSVYNFSVFAGSVVIPDLDIRHRSLSADDDLTGIGAKLDAVRQAGEAPPDVAAADRAPGDGHIEIDDDTVKSIDLVVRGYVEGGTKPLGELGNRLVDYKKGFVERTGVGKNSKRVWFGYPTLKSFIRNTFPRYKLGDNSIGQDDDTAA
ncbi:hypothetical protein [Sphingomonas bacterium]|uniref:NYN domain-containing protein n=1 Tax=Sphingomonas bacterium TaxID=1895847 RepID=UPI00261C9631|nr:hypothetical protein [Sphingomonas bacterium]MDB5678222.1 hypothetical protein [Sphingomonas bacterium]